MRRRGGKLEEGGLVFPFHKAHGEGTREETQERMSSNSKRRDGEVDGDEMRMGKGISINRRE